MRITQEQLNAVKEISKGDYGIWTLTAKMCIKDSSEFQFIQMFRDQLKDAEESMKNSFPVHIIEELK